MPALSPPFPADALLPAGGPVHALQPIFEQAPVAVAVLRGPRYVVEWANPAICRLWGRTQQQAVGTPLFELLPEVAGQGFEALLDGVMATGVPHVADEAPTRIDRPGRPGTAYFNFVYQPLRAADGRISGVAVVATEVSEQVAARRQVQALNEQLAVANAALQATNEELHHHNAALRRAQRQLQQLNQTLETRVAAGVEQAQAARADAEAQRGRLERLFMAAPAAICIMAGPELVYELVNPIYAELLPGRALLGRPVLDAVPEIAHQPAYEALRQVYVTGIPHSSPAQLVPLARPADGAMEDRYFNLIYQARRDEAGAIDGILAFGLEVTEQVTARQQVEQLNQVLEARVAERTLAAGQAQADAEAQRQQLDRFFQQAPVAIAVLDGPTLTYELVNPGLQQMFPGRALLGRPLLEALPEIVGHPVAAAMRAVYDTGQSHEERAMLVPFEHPGTGVLEDRFFTYVLQARRAAAGRIDGVLLCAFEVTAQVQAQRRADALQAEVLASAQRLLAERETTHQMFEHTPAAICIQRGPAHHYEYVNPAHQALFPNRSMLGRSVAEALPETVDAGFVALLDAVYHTGTTYFGHEQPLLVAQPDGRPPLQMYFTFTYQAYRENGVIVGISTLAYNVAGQVLARQRREAQQRQTVELFEQAPVAIAVLRGPRYVVEVANPAICALWSRTPQQAVGTPLFELLPELVGQGLDELLDGVLATGVPHVADELPIRMARAGHAETAYFNFVYQPLRAADGRITGVGVVATEVSELLRARRELATQARLRAVFEQAPVAIGVFAGPDYVVEVCNPGLQAIWGRTAEQALHRPMFEVLPELADKGFRELLDGVVRTGESYVAREVAAQVQRDGQLVPVYVSFVYHPLRDAQGAVTAVAAVATDVSEQVAARRQVQRLNESLTALNDKLYAANAALGDANEELGYSNQQLTRTNVDLDTFVYTASHDLRAPITNLDGLLRALREELPDAAQVGLVAHVLALMQESVDRFQHTLEQLGAIARLQQEHGTPAAAVPLADVVRDVRFDLALPLAEAGAQLVVDLEGAPAIPFAEKNLRSVVFNLLSNALKYRHPDRPPVVHLRCRPEGPYWVFEVQDNGLGLDITPARPLFGLFQRYHTHVDGSGVGLYMVKKMVENAGGRVEVRSQLGAGSTFTVYFKR